MARRWSLILCLALAPACVQVLGLEDAKLDENDASGGSSATNSGGVARSPLSCSSNPGPSCPCEQAPSSSCTSCLEGCGSDWEECVGDAECRSELEEYGFCLGQRCDADPEPCAFDFVRPMVRNCVLRCAAACPRTQLVSECALYCACMADICASEQFENCMTTCSELPAEVTTCRRLHCVLAGLTSGEGRTLHCQHASNTQPACQDYDERPEEDREVCLDGNESTWPCNVDSECCSEVCLDGVCD
jgi:hypothetical protein